MVREPMKEDQAYKENEDTNLNDTGNILKVDNY